MLVHSFELDTVGEYPWECCWKYSIKFSKKEEASICPYTYCWRSSRQREFWSKGWFCSTNTQEYVYRRAIQKSLETEVLIIMWCGHLNVIYHVKCIKVTCSLWWCMQLLSIVPRQSWIAFLSNQRCFKREKLLHNI